MSVMSTTYDAIPYGRPLTIDDLGATPDDGNRYELIDGVLVVSAAPRRIHGFVAEALADVLRRHCPRGWRVMTTEFATVLSPDTLAIPDLVVLPALTATEMRDESHVDEPQLVVEVLSPSTALNDLNVKFARFERAGIPSYWVVDPDSLRLIAWELTDGRYVEVADVTDGSWTATRPFEVTIAPSELLD
ncbi:Uma2 family endonuclease [Nocardioides sp.]|uniref:Uma2 family endonuclease n=1 Tax=Nocardioides sp. TaxID=35761 RepID=UPI0039E63601